MAVYTEHKRTKKICYSCNKTISGHFVRALNRVYHMDCFRCTDCSKPCSSKFFPILITKEPVVNNNTSAELEPIQDTVPLCEQCYFRRQDLLCASCEGALRGSYITAMGKKYHVEHFTCSLCSTVFGTDDSYYEHEDMIYCRFHYSKLYASRCEGCKTAILRQFVEVFKGGRNQQWHPECYMISKFWVVEINKPGEVDYSEEDRDKLLKLEEETEAKTFEIWTVLCSYEENAASSISDMLQYATANLYHDTLKACAMFIWKVEVLISATNWVNKQLLQKNLNVVMEKEQSEKELLCLFRKFIKYVNYIIFLQKKVSGATEELLDSVAGMAHYLKLLIRYGLSTSLRYDRTIDEQPTMLHQFLEKIKVHTDAPENPLDTLEVSGTESDKCVVCGTNIEDDCIAFKDMRWHLSCFKCSRCTTLLSSEMDNARLIDNNVVCVNCAGDNSTGLWAFEYVTKLQQLIYLVKLAVAKLQLALDSHSNEDNRPISAGPDLTAATTQKNDVYMKTLRDIRSSRLSHHVSDSSKLARRSKVFDLPANGSDSFDASQAWGEDNAANTEDSQDFNKPASRLSLNRTTDLIKNEKSLILDDIPRIVAAEQARELQPNAFKHRNKEGQEWSLKEISKETCVYLSELSKNELVYVKHIAVVLVHPEVSQWFSLEALLQLIEQRKTPSSSIWNKFGRAFGSKTDRGKKCGVFGYPLELQIDKYGVESEFGIGPTTLKVPSFMDECISALRQKDMSVEGIFRKNGNIRRLKELTDMIEKSPERSGFLKDESAIQLAALLKKFLRDLPDSLLTFSLEKLWLKAQEEPDITQKLKNMHLITCMLPKHNRDVMEILFYFLYWTASFSHINSDEGSKMDIHNLATVITPNVLYSNTVISGSSSSVNISGAKEELGESLLAIEAVDLLIRSCERFAKVPNEILNILSQFTVPPDTEAINTKDLVNAINTKILENGAGDSRRMSEPELNKPVRPETFRINSAQGVLH